INGPFFLTPALLPLMVDVGVILHVTSASVRVAPAGVAPSAAPQSGLATLTRYQSKESCPRSILANTISHGPILTNL
ncbi:SDR family oxidoreductase, partial [Rhizobium johnstonii]|uniref:SDR family oxidoreductase n=1 Tax=Rhizobium johnstonii TaxID=3019933 RepID=UPI003F95EF73